MVRYTTADEIDIAIKTAHRQDFTVGLVLAHDALRPGHLELIRKAARENDRVIVGIFSPSKLTPQDAAICQEGGADWIYNPDSQESDPTGSIDRMIRSFKPDRVYVKEDMQPES